MWFLLTVVIFLASRWISAKLKSPLANPLLISIIALIAILMCFGIKFDTYFAQNAWVNFLLQPAVVALAYPLYEQLPQIRENWKIILLACTAGSALSMLATGTIALVLGADQPLITVLLTKSITTPIAMEVAANLGGEPSIAAIFVIIAGLLGAIFAYPVYSILRINQPLAIGLTTGTVSHALGTSACAEHDPRDAAFSSLALVLCGIFTSILAPFFFKIFSWLYPFIH